MNSTVVFAAIALFVTVTALAQPIVNADGSAFPITSGMTLRQAVQALKPEYQTYALGGDTGWYLQIHDGSSQNVLMTLWADDSQDYVINYSAKVGYVTLYSDRYVTREGVHAGMRIRDVEKRLGKLKRIITSHLNAVGIAEFANMPEGVSFEISGPCRDEGQRRKQEVSSEGCITAVSVDMR